MAKGMGFKAFLNEKSRGSNTSRLRKWREDGEIIVWLHTNSSLYKRLVHVITYTYTEKNEKTGKEVENIGYFYFVCPEDPDEFMNRRYSKTYPSVCPMCRFIDWVANNDDIDSKTVVWETSVGDRKNDRICNKADITNDADAGGDWRLSMLPQSDYVLAVIDNDNVKDGILVATEKYSLGEAIKKVVLETIDSDGEELGDPSLNPYAIKWVYNAKAKKSTDYYRAYKYNQAQLTPEIAELLNQPALDFSSMIEMGDISRLREYMQQGIVLEDVPLDIFFDAVEDNTDFDPEKIEAEEKAAKKSAKAPAKTQEKAPAKSATRAKTAKKEPEPEVADDVCPMCLGTGERKGKACGACNGTGYIEEEEAVAAVEDPAPVKSLKRTPKPKPEPEPVVEDDEEAYECGSCGKRISATDDKCPHCGESFE